MTGDKDMFLTLKKERDGSISFGNDNSTIIIGRGTIKLGSKDAREENVLLVEDMKHNLLSVSQMCDQGHKLMFDSEKCEIRKEGSGKLVATTVRTPSNIYVLNEIGKERCFLGKDDESWLWHRRMGHINFDNLVKINRKEAVREIPRSQSQQILYASIVYRENKPGPSSNQRVLHNKTTRDCTY
jgi:hypothetical protein